MTTFTFRIVRRGELVWEVGTASADTITNAVCKVWLELDEMFPILSERHGMLNWLVNTVYRGERNVWTHEENGITVVYASIE